jgi:DNA polymerase-3 subunit delta'
VFVDSVTVITNAAHVGPRQSSDPLVAAYLPVMAIIPLYGHRDLQGRLRDALSRNSLPGSLLFQGSRGVGKQRLALWLAQLLLCQSPADAPCGTCQSCHFSLALTHPDLHWYFPRPRLKDADDLDDVKQDYAEAIAERAQADGLYQPPSGLEGIFVATVRLIVQQAALSPAIARRKVFIIGDAERMTPQEGAEFAANAFLKLLEEPPADTTIILTSSEPGALLPTVRSRVVSLRVPPLSADDMRQFLADTDVATRLDGDPDVPRSPAERVVLAGGAPGRLLSGAAWSVAMDTARRLLAAVSKPGGRYDVAWGQGASKARGSFADTLDALTVLLNEHTRSSVRSGADESALGATRAIEVLELAKERVASNVSPQLITVNLLRELGALLT